LAAQHFGPWNALDCGFVFQSHTLQRDIIGKEARINPPEITAKLA
jgi:hypothetical protein